MWSGVPHGSILGPIMFLIFINDLDNGLSSTVLKFVDDTKLFKPINNYIDCQELQRDLDNVCNWASRWQMKFNVTKCKVMHYDMAILNIIIVWKECQSKKWIVRRIWESHSPLT